MSRRGKSNPLVSALLIGSLAILGLEWLRSDYSRCDLGCQNAAEHLERHILSALLRGFLGG